MVSDEIDVLTAYRSQFRPWRRKVVSDEIAILTAYRILSVLGGVK